MATDSQGDSHLIFLNGDILVYLYDGVAQQLPEYGSTWSALDIQQENYDQPRNHTNTTNPQPNHPHTLHLFYQGRGRVPLLT